MSRADDLRLKIDELEDTLACLEHDIEMGDEDAALELDTLACELCDLRDELSALEAGGE